MSVQNVAEFRKRVATDAGLQAQIKKAPRSVASLSSLAAAAGVPFAAQDLADYTNAKDINKSELTDFELEYISGGDEWQDMNGGDPFGSGASTTVSPMAGLIADGIASCNTATQC